MTLWIVLAVAIALAASALTIPLVRFYDRRKAHAEASAPLRGRAVLFSALGAVAVGLSALALHAAIDIPPPVPGFTHAATGLANPDHPVDDVNSMIAGLAARLKNAPNDPEGWWMLGWSYMRTGKAVEAADAYGRAASLKPENVEYLSAQGEALVQAAGGKVSPDVREIFRRVVAAGPTDPRARYYLAVYKDQNGDSAGAMEDWIALVKGAPAGAPWGSEIRTFIEGLARERGLDISAKLPPLPVTASGSPPQL